MMWQHSSPVVIVGGGPVGLVLSILLSHHGVEHQLVETHPATSVHPKARGISARSMEILRQIGLEDRVRSAGLPADHVSMYRGTSLVDPDFVRTTVKPDVGGREVTPSPGVICSQDVLEAILLERARELAGDRIRFGAELVSFTQNSDGVRAVIEDAGTENTWNIDAEYLIGCDGTRSRTRRGCGIVMEGVVGLRYYFSARFRAPLGAVVADRASASYFLTPPGVGGFMAIDNDTHWIYQYPFDPDADAPDTFGDQRWVELIRAAAGIDDLDVTVLDTMTWRMDATLATTYRHGRVFLAGDAAHAVPPTGGHGMNVGIGDADNLAWKLAAVLHGQGGDGLLGTYEVERRPIARQVIDIATDNALSRGRYRIDDELLLTVHYVSSAVIDSVDPAGSRINPGGYLPTGMPGHRLPHLQVTRPGGSCSTLDRIDGFTLFHGPTDSDLWRQHAIDASRSGVPVADRTVTQVATEAECTQFQELCGLSDAGALLVRPDGHIAWRADTPPPPGTLDRVLCTMLSRDPPIYP